MKHRFSGVKTARFWTLIVLLTLTTTLCQTAGADSWLKKQHMPTAREAARAAVVSDLIYVTGGDIANQVRLNVNEVYDQATDTWATRAPMPTARSSHVLAAVNGKIYVIGGVLNSMTQSVNEEYDPVMDTWTTKAPMPTPRQGASFGVVNGIIYVIAGFNVQSGQLTSVDAYDPTTDTWQTGLNSIPFTANEAGHAVVDDKIYVIGGQTFPNKVQIYDPATDTWSLGADMPTGRNDFATVVLNGKINAIGGTLPPAVYKVNEQYDPVFDAWTTKTPMPGRRCFGLAAEVVNGKAYVIGGANFTHVDPFRTNREYTPD